MRDPGAVAVRRVAVGVIARVCVNIKDRPTPQIFNRGGERHGSRCGEQELAATDHGAFRLSQLPRLRDWRLCLNLVYIICIQMI